MPLPTPGLFQVPRLPEFPPKWPQVRSRQVLVCRLQASGDAEPWGAVCEAVGLRLLLHRHWSGFVGETEEGGLGVREGQGAGWHQVATFPHETSHYISILKAKLASQVQVSKEENGKRLIQQFILDGRLGVSTLCPGLGLAHAGGRFGDGPPE